MKNIKKVYYFRLKKKEYTILFILKKNPTYNNSKINLLEILQQNRNQEAVIKLESR